MRNNFACGKAKARSNLHLRNNVVAIVLIRPLTPNLRYNVVTNVLLLRRTRAKARIRRTPHPRGRREGAIGLMRKPICCVEPDFIFFGALYLIRI